MEEAHPETPARKRRRAFAVTSSLQYRFMAMTLIYGFVIVFFFAVVVFVPDLIEMLDDGLSSEIRSHAAARILVKHSWVWPAVFLLIVVLGLHSFRMFTRVAGPLYRFRWAFSQVENGNLRLLIKTRKRDYLRTEEKALNEMINALGGKLGIVKAAVEEAFTSMEELEHGLDKGNEWSRDQLVLLRAHRERLERLAAAVGHFRLWGK